MIYRLIEFREALRAKKEFESYDDLEKEYKINRYYLWNIIHREDFIPPGRILASLGIEAPAVVIAINGSIPDGTQALMASFCAKCGRPYITNHPGRKRCFICSPYRGVKQQ